ncbi:MAG: penicillin-binding transpeptidase domain-containing protein, partial [Prevotella sp.]
NIGISYMVDKFYHNNPEKFVKGIYRTGINDPNIRIPIVGHATPQIRMPKRFPNGQWRNWSKTALMWMSIGYETQIPPIYTLTFYNAIANGGRMMQPRFVKAAVMNGDTIAEFPPEVVKGREQIASDKTIKIIQDLLRRVVVKGTGKKANTPNFYICGKTGTAMIARNGSYKGMPNHLLSFAGWFGTKEEPLYSCIVCIQKTGMPAFGWMSAEVFRDIAEGIMAKYVKYDISDARDSSSVPIPDVKTGNILSADYVLSKLGISTHTNFTSNFANPKPVWGVTERRKGSVILRKKDDLGIRYMPNVIGMGARDAVYLIEKRGVKCRLKGRGKVSGQSLEAGHFIKKGEVCVLTLD